MLIATSHANKKSEPTMMPDATAKVFRHDGLFDTGDRVRRDSSGYIFFADRSKDMLKVGGENVAASEVERVILETSYVQEAAVVAKPDLMRGEVPVAYVIPNASAPSNLEAVIIAACQGRLAKFKVPVEVRIVDSFPRAALNKVAKSELRARLLVPSGAGQ
jgi:crotonobetaine/carnitine-CoA ligase